MKHLIVDSNNIASLSFHRAKTTMKKEIYSKIGAKRDALVKDDKLSYEEVEEIISNLKKELDAEMMENITGFAIHFFFNKVHNILKLYKGYRPIFVWDGKYGSVWRKKSNGAYKGTRNHDGDSLYPIYIDMMNSCRSTLELYPLFQLSREDAEADDIIYSIIKYLDSETVVVSTDTDMIQLPQRFKNVTIWNPIKKELHEIPDYNYVLFKSIVGDKSDNIFGVPRYGKAKGRKAAIDGIETLSEEHQKIVRDNLEIIDLSLNPNEPANREYVESILNKTDRPDCDVDKIKKCFFDLKLKQQVDKFGPTSKLIKSIP